jgi:hypothetical protein
VILFEMLTGHLPFEAGEPLELALQHIKAPPPDPTAMNPALAPEAAAVLLKALAKEPAGRYGSGAELIGALEAALANSAAAAPSAPAELPAARSVPERVTVQFEQKPLPPLANGEIEAAPPLPPPTASLRSRLHLRRPRPLLLLAGCAGLLLFLILTLALGLSLGRDGDGLELLSRPEDGEYSVFLPAVGSEGGAGAAQGGAATLTLRLVRSGQSGLVLINDTGSTLPLSPLRLGEGDGAVQGTDWSIPELASGSCAAVWRDKGEVDAPEGECAQLAPPVVRDRRGRFWLHDFAIFYGEEHVASCPRSADECPITITLAAP